MQPPQPPPRWDLPGQPPRWEGPGQSQRWAPPQYAQAWVPPPPPENNHKQLAIVAGVGLLCFVCMAVGLVLLTSPSTAPTPSSSPSSEMQGPQAVNTTPAVQSSGEMVPIFDPGQLFPPSLPGYPQRSGVSRLMGPADQRVADYYALDGSHLHLNVQPSNGPMDTDGTVALQVLGHRARRATRPAFTWIGWRSGSFLFLCWAYGPNSGTRIELSRVLPAMQAWARYADAQVAASTQ